MSVTDKKTSERPEMKATECNVATDLVAVVDASAGVTVRMKIAEVWNAVKRTFTAMTSEQIDVVADSLVVAKADGTTGKITPAALNAALTGRKEALLSTITDFGEGCSQPTVFSSFGAPIVVGFFDGYMLVSVSGGFSSNYLVSLLNGFEAASNVSVFGSVTETLDEDGARAFRINTFKADGTIINDMFSCLIHIIDFGA